MERETREQFDMWFDEVMEHMPPDVHQLLAEVPLLIEDYPSDEIMEMFDIAYRDELCGLHDGIPITDRSVEHPTPDDGIPDHIIIYREGILAHAAGQPGGATAKTVKNEIRITILHEIGHHFGLDEDDLERLGYG